MEYFSQTKCEAISAFAYYTNNVSHRISMDRTIPFYAQIDHKSLQTVYHKMSISVEYFGNFESFQPSVIRANYMEFNWIRNKPKLWINLRLKCMHFHWDIFID